MHRRTRSALDPLMEVVYRSLRVCLAALPSPVGRMQACTHWPPMSPHDPCVRLSALLRVPSAPG